jgi:hypothetical protein
MLKKMILFKRNNKNKKMKTNTLNKLKSFLNNKYGITYELIDYIFEFAELYLWEIDTPYNPQYLSGLIYKSMSNFMCSEETLYFNPTMFAWDRVYLYDGWKNPKDKKTNTGKTIYAMIKYYGDFMKEYPKDYSILFLCGNVYKDGSDPFVPCQKCILITEDDYDIINDYLKRYFPFLNRKPLLP